MQSLVGLIFWIAVAAVIYSWKKSKAIQQENLEDFESNEEYQKFKKITKIAAAVCVVSMLLYNNVESSDEKEIKAVVTERQTQAFELAKKIAGQNDANIKQDITFDKIDVDGDHAIVYATTRTYNGKDASEGKSTFELRKIEGKWNFIKVK